MNVTGLHLLLTYQCNFECDHCFVWGSPWQHGAMTLETIREILEQASDLGTVDWIYFEGGEAFLYYGALVEGIEKASAMGFRTGIVSNAYWATSREDAVNCLRPFAGKVQDLSISSDAYHWSDRYRRYIENAVSAAGELEIPVELISIAQPEDSHAAAGTGQIPPGESAVVFRGRAAKELASRADHHHWASFTECPFEELASPERVHLDPFGNVHICQGIVMGNLFERPLTEIFGKWDAREHPVTGPLLDGGPAELARRHGIDCGDGYADACHLCYETRCRLRDRFPAELAPDQMYGSQPPD
jgi:MoaA/NifB/PqqE/SkfB family radical SAM enzyme